MRSQAKRLGTLGAVIAAALCGIETTAVADPIPQGWAASNMEPIGYSDLEGRRGAFKMTLKQSNGRWYMYLGHLWHRGWTIVDVTDPKSPTFVKHIPAPANTWSIQVTSSGNILITALQKAALNWGLDDKGPHDEGVLIWDISDPVNPKQISHWKTGSQGTHRNSYPGGRYAYLSASANGFDGRILVILDVSDPKQPKETGRWWQPGQKEGEAKPADRSARAFHGPAMISPDGKMATMGYSPSLINLDISNPASPKLIGQLQFTPPFFGAGGQALHTAFPLWDRNLVHVNSEPQVERCKEPAHFAGLVDNSAPANPRLISLYPVPVPPKGAPYKNFCEKGGRFGPHNVNQEIHLPEVEKPGSLIYLTYFNAGLRVFNIKDPLLPVESGWFIPPNPPKVPGARPSVPVAQTEDVLVDTRGNVFVTDKTWGLWVLRYTGPDQPAPTDK